MSLSDLCDDIFLIIVTKVGYEDFSNLGSIIRSNSRGRNIALSPTVLRTANISSLCSSPTKIYPAGVGRKFFTRCLQAGNVSAIYYESLRLITREHDVHGAISLLNQLVPAYGHATLAYAMFQMCAGRGEIAGNVLEFFLDNFAGPLTHPTYSPHLDDMCQDLISKFMSFDPPLEDTFGPTWEFPTTSPVDVPTCGDWHGEDFDCPECYIFNAAVRICELL